MCDLHPQYPKKMLDWAANKLGYKPGVYEPPYMIHGLCKNPNATTILENSNMEYINWGALCANPNAISILEANQDKIHWHILSGNPNAISILEANQDKIHWHILSSNPNAISILEKHPDKIDWWWLSMNPNAIHLIENKIKEEAEKETFCYKIKQFIYGDTPPKSSIHWPWLSRNLNAVPILKKNLDKIDWGYLSMNPSPDAIELLRENLDKININYLVKNTNPIAFELIELLDPNMDTLMIYYDQTFQTPFQQLLENPYLSMKIDAAKYKYQIITNEIFLYKNPRIDHFIDFTRPLGDGRYPYKFTNVTAWKMPAYTPASHYWYELSRNPGAIELLRQNPECINIDAFLDNPAIFAYDYDAMRENRRELNQEILECFWRPDWMKLWRHELNYAGWFS